MKRAIVSSLLILAVVTGAIRADADEVADRTPAVPSAPTPAPYNDYATGNELVKQWVTVNASSGADLNCPSWAGRFMNSYYSVATESSGVTFKTPTRVTIVNTSMMHICPVGNSTRWHGMQEMLNGGYLSMDQDDMWDLAGYLTSITGLPADYPPEIISVTPGDACGIMGSSTTTLTAIAHDPDGDGMTPEWTALDGGQILGGGWIVHFLAPDVAATRACNVQLIVRDDYGVPSGPWTVPIEVRVAGDLTGDGGVDHNDLPPFAQAFNTSQGDADYSCTADFNADGRVDLEDLAVFSARYGQPMRAGADPAP